MTALPLPVESLAIIEHLDEDWAVPCECGYVGAPCDRAAEWVAWKTDCCPARQSSVLACGPCRALITDPEATLACNCCKTVFQPASTAWASFEPLNRRTK
jgi:hypothetical protein